MLFIYRPKVAFIAPEGSGYLTQFYNGKSSFSEADSVPVKAGKTKSEIDAAMQTGGQITGQVTSASTKAVLTGIQVCILETETCAKTNASGEYTISTLPTGSYKVGFFAPEGSGLNYLTQFYDDKSSFSEAEAVTVQAGKTKTGINAAMVAGGDFTWSGEGAPEEGGGKWSNTTNWASHSAPATSSSIGRLTLPNLTSPACASEPTDACYNAANDIGGLKVNELTLDGPYSISGDSITLGAGGLLQEPSSVVLGFPIELGAAQTWHVAGQPEGAPASSGVALTGGLGGEGHALVVDTSNGAGVGLFSKAEVGAITFTGVEPADTGALAALNGGVELAPGGSLNSSDGNPITLTDDALAGAGETGPIKGLGGEIGVGCGVLGVSCGLGEVPGALHAASVELDSHSNATFLLSKDGEVPVTDYAQLTSGGTVSLGGASLAVDLAPSGGTGACTLELSAGEKLVLISTTGTLSGAFSNAPEGDEIPLDQLGLCSASTQKLRIEYHEEGSPETVTATVLESGSAPIVSTFSALSTNATTARIEGQVYPASKSTTYHAAYDLTSAEWCTSSGSKGSPGHSTTPVTLPFIDATFHNVTVELTGLTAGSEYCTELIASNGSGMAHGGQRSFMAGAPSVLTLSASSDGASAEVVYGDIAPSGQSTTYHVAYDLASSEWCTSSGTKGSPGHSTTAVTLPFNDTAYHQVSVELTALTTAGKYCAWLLASNGSGTTHGGQISFTPGVPSAFTLFALSTGATTARLEGRVNPSGQSTTYHAAYDLTSSEWCTSFGSKGSPGHSSTPATLGFTDSSDHAVSAELTGLTAGGDYCAEMIATNASGTAHGGQVSFTAGIPAASTTNAALTGAMTARVEGQVNPASQSTTYHVAYDLASSEWCTTSGGKGTAGHSTTAVTLPFTDATFHNVSVELTGLTAGSEYCTELIASNGSGTAHGGQRNFTAGAPSVVTFSASPISASIETVDGQMNPAGQSTTYHVAYDLASSEWCTTSGGKGTAAHSTTPVTLPFTDAVSHNVSVELTGLTAGGDYCAEMIATNASGTAHGGQVSFIPGVPSAFTFVASPTGATNATVQGEINPVSQSTTYHVAYDLVSSEWCTTSGGKGTAGHSTTAVTLPFTDATFHNVSVELTGLTAGSEYCAELVAVNGSGAARGGQRRFTAGAPSALLFSEVSKNTTTTAVEGEVNPASQSTTYHVAYDLASSEWCTTSGGKGTAGHSTTAVTLPFTDATFHDVSVELTGLTAGGHYCAELIATNAAHTAHSGQQTFTAGAPTVAISRSMSTGAMSESIEGEVNPASQSTTYHVAYDLASSEWCTSQGSKGTLGHSTTAVTLPFTDATFHNVSVGLTGLVGGNEYCAELIAVNGSGAATSRTSFVVELTPPQNIEPPGISGVAQQGKTLKDLAGTWSEEPTKFKYQWLQCNKAGGECSEISGAKESTYVSAPGDVGHTVRVEETAENGAGAGMAATSAQTAEVVPPIPVNTALPTITGTAQQGKTLTEHHGSWEYSPTEFKYQWMQCNKLGEGCLPINGEIGQTYQPKSVDVGTTLRVEEFAKNAGGTSGPAVSLATVEVLPAVPVAVSPPTISGAPVQGETLTEIHGAWTNEPTGYTYLWERCPATGGECEPIEDATEQTYLIQKADIGHELLVQETASNTGGPSTARASAVTAVVEPPIPVNTEVPTISGTARDGSTLTEQHGTWTNHPTSYTYQWEQCDPLGSSCALIEGATNQSYMPTQTNVGSTLVVQEIAKNTAGEGAPAVSLPTPIVAPEIPANTSPPSISGTPQTGQTLLANHGIWSNQPTQYGEQWLRCDSVGENCQPITGEINLTYVPASADVGHTLEVQETATNAGGTSAAIPSTPTAVVSISPLHADAGEDSTTTIGAEVTFDGSGSTPASEITAYHWDFGDGSSSTEEIATHSYSQAGVYTATLTVSRGGETSKQSVTVTVTPPPPKEAAVTVLDGENHPLQGAEVLYDGSGGTKVEASTATSGEAELPGLPDGTDTVYVYKHGFQPAVGQIAVTEGGGAATVTLTVGEIATSKLEAHEMSKSEIESAGINPAAPGNSFVTEFEVSLAFGSLHCYINGSSQFVGSCSSSIGGFTCSAQSCAGGGFVAIPAIVEGHPLIQWLVLGGKASFLKQFFSVSMIVQNLSPEPFKLTGGNATLAVPPGMSLAPTPTPQRVTQPVPDIPGLASSTSTWIVRGDSEGEYFLSASYHGKLQPFNAAVDLEAKLASPLHVWGASALKFHVQADSGSLTEGVPYHVRIGLENVADIPLYNLAVAIDSNEHANFIFQPSQQFEAETGELKPGETFYAPEDIVVPSVSTGAFDPSLSSARFAGQEIHPGEGIEAVTPPKLYNLTADTSVAEQVTLRWEAIPGAHGYQIFRTPDLKTPFGAALTVTAPGSTGQVTEVTGTEATVSVPAGQTYLYAVSTVHDGINTLYHLPVSVTAKAPGPPTVTGLTATPGKSSALDPSTGLPPAEVELKWSVPAKATVDSYRIDWTDEQIGDIGTLAVPAGTTSATVTGLRGCDEYRFEVSAEYHGQLGPGGSADTVADVPIPKTNTPKYVVVMVGGFKSSRPADQYNPLDSTKIKTYCPFVAGQYSAKEGSPGVIVGEVRGMFVGVGV